MLNLVRALPYDAALHREAHGGVAWGWDQEMAAFHVELTHALMRTMAAGFGAKHSKLPKPLEVPRPRPMVPSAPKRKATVREMMQILGPMLGDSNG